MDTNVMVIIMIWKILENWQKKEVSLGEQLKRVPVPTIAPLFARKERPTEDRGAKDSILDG
jgi:hypothetical protein